jgi:tetratricopeptide (TPR) repeat protein
VEAADRLFLRLYNDFPNSPLGNSVVAGEVVRCIAVLDSGRPHQAEDRLAVLRSHYPRHASLLGQAHLAVLKYFARRRMSEEALEVGQRILKAYPGENDILARTRTTIGRIYLGKRKKHAAVDMFNQCIGTYHSSPGVWEAWMALGEVYAYDRNFIDALSVYRKVYTECPKSVPLPWMARIRMGETAHRSRSHEPQPRVFEHVARGRHPFPQVRLIAELYSGACEPDSFVGRWTRLHPGNRDHHYFLARRALMQDRKAEALRHLDALLASLPQDSWGYVRVFSLKNEIERL